MHIKGALELSIEERGAGGSRYWTRGLGISMEKEVSAMQE